MLLFNLNINKDICGKCNNFAWFKNISRLKNVTISNTDALQYDFRMV